MRAILRHILLMTLLSSIAVAAYADTEEERRLAISIPIFPRLVAVDEDLDNKLVNGNIQLALVYLNHGEKANDTASQMAAKVSNIAGKMIVVQPITVEKLKQTGAGNFSGLFIVEPLPGPTLSSLISLSADAGVLLFSPYEGDVESGVTASIFVGARIRPYFNTSSIKKAGIKLKPAIMGVSKLYE